MTAYAEPAASSTAASPTPAQPDSGLLLRTLRFEDTPRRPLWIMRQAGRILPEYRALKERHGFAGLARDPELAARVTLMPLRRFPFDAAIIFADIMSPLPALGVDFRFDPGPVIARPLRDAAAVAALPDPDQLDDAEIAPEVTAAQRIVRRELDPGKALLGFAGAPLTLAAYLVQGRGVRDFPLLRAFAHEEPAAFDSLLDRLGRLCARYLIAQHRAGADAVQVFDSWAGLFARAEWRRRVRPHLERLLVRLGDAGVTRILFLHAAPSWSTTTPNCPAKRSASTGAPTSARSVNNGRICACRGTWTRPCCSPATRRSGVRRAVCSKACPDAATS